MTTGETNTESASEQYAREVEDVERRFRYYPVDTESRRTAHERMRAAGLELGLELLRLVPPSRERSLALTAVEEATMWGNAGIARNYATADDLAAPARRPMTAGELGLVEGVSAGRRDVEPDPVGPAGTQNPASLVGTEDMPGPEGSDVPDPLAAPARNVTEPAEAPHVPSVAPEFADEPTGGQPPAAIADPDTDTSP